MADEITCPMCQGTVVLSDGVRSLCRDCHDMTDAELAAEVQKRVDRTLWVALRAVEDQAAYFRLQQSRGLVAPSEYEEAVEAAEVLGDILRKRRSRG